MRISLRLGSIVMLALAACSVETSKLRPPPTGGEGINVDANQAITVDATKVPVVPACTDGQIVQRTATGWACIAAPSGSISVTSLNKGDATCAEGGVKIDSSGNTSYVCNGKDSAVTVTNANAGEGGCAAGGVKIQAGGGEPAFICKPTGVDETRTPVVPTCAEGQVPQKTATGWACVTPAAGIDPTRTPFVANCGTNQYVRMGATGWECSPVSELDVSKTPVVQTCAVGEAIRKTQTGWECWKPVEVDAATTPVLSTCATGRVPRKTASGWECYAPAEVDPLKTPVVAGCTAGQVVKKTATGWECVLAAESASVPSTCTVGQTIQMTAAGWVCAPSSTGRLSSLKVFDSSGDFTVPAGISTVFVEAWGGGDGGGAGVGSGAANGGSLSSGNGGRGGNFVKGFVPVQPGSTIFVVVGQGGAPGSPGTASQFGSLLHTSNGADASTAGGSAAASAMFTRGGPGTPNSCNSNCSAGSASPPCPVTNGGAAPGAGANGSFPGGGGAGGGSSCQPISGTGWVPTGSSGNAGANGRVVITY